MWSTAESVMPFGPVPGMAGTLSLIPPEWQACKMTVKLTLFDKRDEQLLPLVFPYHLE